MSDAEEKADNSLAFGDIPMSPKEIERARERNELQSALRNFAEHFGAVEVYRQARSICMESDEGCAAIKEDWVEFQSEVSPVASRLEDRSEARFQKIAVSSGRTSNKSSAFADAKKALGG